MNLLTPWPIACLGLYLAIAAGLLLGNHRAHRKPSPAPEIVNWLPLLPPVPPPHREPDADWLDAWPVDGLSDDEVYIRFSRIVGVA